MLNRVFSFTRREEPQAFEPRKRTMATTCYGRSDGEATEPATPSQEPALALALNQMTLAIEDGLLMVLGPEGDPVPPQAFADAAAVRPEALLNLPDGAPVAASRVAAVLDAQTQGRLDGAGQGADWVLAMLRDCDLPDAAAEDALAAERASCVLTAAGNELTVTCAAGAFQIVGVAPLAVSGDAMGLYLGDDAPISVAGLIGLMRERSTPADQPGSDDPALRGTIELRADGLWFGLPGLAVQGGGVHLARRATSAPNGPVVSALADGRVASLADLIGLAAGNEIEAGAHDQATGTAGDPALRGDDPDLSADREDANPGDVPSPDGPGEAPHDTFPFATAPFATAPIAIAEPDGDRGDRIAPYEQADPSGGMSAVTGHDLPDMMAGDHAQGSACVDAGTAVDGPCDPGPAGNAVGQQTDVDLADVDLADQAPGELEITHAPEPADAEQAAAEQADAEQADIDPESILLVVIRGVPEDAMLSAGMRDDDGSWSVLPVDLPNVMISLGSRGSGGDGCGEAGAVDGDLDITGIALDDDGALVAISETVPLAQYLDDPVQPQEIAAEPADDPAGAPEPCGIPLEVDPRAWAGERFDALVIRDLPAGADLSAGTYDPAIDAWVLRPQDLSALTVRPPAGLRADFTVTLMGVALRPGAAGAARMLARLPVTLA